MPVDDAISLMNSDFSNYKNGGRSVPLNIPFSNERHPDAIQVLVNMLADNHQLTVLQYDRIIKYLEMKREEQIQIELGDAKDVAGASSIGMSDPKQAELQSRILNILNSNKPNANAPVPSPVPAPAPVPPSTWAIGKNRFELLALMFEKISRTFRRSAYQKFFLLPFFSDFISPISVNVTVASKTLINSEISSKRV